MLRCSTLKLFPTKAVGGSAGYVEVVAQDMWRWWRRICGGGGAGYVVVYAPIIMPLRGPSCKLRFARISVRLKFQDSPSVATMLDNQLPQLYNLLFGFNESPPGFYYTPTVTDKEHQLGFPTFF